jgi:hypothetical protein
VTFRDQYTLKVGSQTLELSDHGVPESLTRNAFPNLIDKGGHFAAWEQPALFI